MCVVFGGKTSLDKAASESLFEKDGEDSTI